MKKNTWTLRIDKQSSHDRSLQRELIREFLKLLFSMCTSLRIWGYQTIYEISFVIYESTRSLQFLWRVSLYVDITIDDFNIEASRSRFENLVAQKYIVSHRPLEVLNRV